MTRLEATRAICAVAGDAAIIASLGHPAYDLFAADDRPRNFYTWGSMGLASSIGLGLALARPDLRVFVLDGDGSLLMNLGSLATIGLLQPAQSRRDRDGQRGVRDDRRTADADRATAPISTRPRARCASTATTVRTVPELTAAVARQTDPLVVVAKVTESAPTAKPPLDYVGIKDRFMAALGEVRG